MSKNLTPTELNYTVAEKEFLAIVHFINKFRQSLTMKIIHKYHFSIRYLMKKPINNGIITRWMLLLQEFNITILDRPRK